MSCSVQCKDIYVNLEIILKFAPLLTVIFNGTIAAAEIYRGSFVDEHKYKILRIKLATFYLLPLLFIIVPVTVTVYIPATNGLLQDIMRVY